MNGRAARVVAHAKVNLRLRILARERSGYHQLETIFQRLALGDDVTVAVGVPSDSLDCRGADVGPVDRNLAWRAASAYREYAGWPSRFAIEIEKRVPVGGGLGGGSADAGAVLRALNALAPTPLSPVALLSLATPLGADVPFLTTDDATALAWGRGERLLPLDPPPEAPVCLLVPSFGVGTAEAYGWLASARGDSEVPISERLDPRATANWNSISRMAVNDFEPPVFSRYPELAELAEALHARGALVSMLAGSGSTVFGVFESDSRPTHALGVGEARELWTRTLSRVEPVSLAE